MGGGRGRGGFCGTDLAPELQNYVKRMYGIFGYDSTNSIRKSMSDKDSHATGLHYLHYQIIHFIDFSDIHFFFGRNSVPRLIIVHLAFIDESNILYSCYLNTYPYVTVIKVCCPRIWLSFPIFFVLFCFIPIFF